MTHRLLPRASAQPTRRRELFLPALFVLLAIAAVASAATLVLPGAASLPGANGTRWTSTLHLSNLGEAGARFEVALLPLPPTPAAAARDLWLAPGESVSIADPLGELFGLAEGAGTLVVSARPLFDARLESANVADPRGTFGAGITGTDLFDALRAGETGHAILASRSADSTRGYRTNVGLALLDAGSRVELRLVDAVGLLRGRTTVSADTAGSRQLSLDELFAGDLPVGRVEFRLLAGRAVGWISVVDNRTGDAVVEMAARLPDPYSPVDLVASGVARSPGLAGTRWSTDLRLWNPGLSALPVQVEPLGLPAGALPLSLSIPAGTLVAIDDLLGPAGFALPDGSAGAVRIRADSPLLAAARTANRPDGGSGGSWASLIPVLPAGAGLLGGLRSADLVGLRQDSSFRTNLALATTLPSLGTLSLVDPAGNPLAAAPFDLPAGSWTQRALPDWFAGVAVPAGSRVELSVDAGELLAYASVVDNGTGDPVVVPAGRRAVDPSSLAGLHLLGYQGWFGTPDDGSPAGRWLHWFEGADPSCSTLRVDLWPDLSELDADELFPTPLRLADGSPARVFSSWTPKTVDRHFRWMERYDLDGVLAQRFLVGLDDPGLAAFREGVLENVRLAAAGRGRGWAVMYDVSGYVGLDLVLAIESDWADLVARRGLTDDRQYLRHRGRPVVGLWGVGFDGRPGTPAEIAELVRFFHENASDPLRATLVAGVPARWRTLAGQSQSDPAWSAVYRSFDVIAPWQVGQFADEAGADAFAASVLAPDLAECEALGIDYRPVLFPGFSWHNLTGAPPNEIPRRAGSLYRREGSNAVAAGCDGLLTAMFDEIDEGTAMMELAPASALPASCVLVPIDADGTPLPTDWYLRLAGEAGRELRAGE